MRTHAALVLAAWVGVGAAASVVYVTDLEIFTFLVRIFLLVIAEAPVHAGPC